ncbi:hypothetical protein [Salibacterium aidingense]|uniref:hypothetical protein n=1 Tax=Salibacterium aidingense TaxID=384933 RepID=UPI000427717A|nr:hypothetical protein [Salibacterium aidingense]
MIVYEASKKDILHHVDQDVLVPKILDTFTEKMGRTNDRETRSWDNSMLHMYRVLNDTAIPDNAGVVAIEYNIPNTSKRVEFLLSGQDGSSDSVVIVEQKQWEKVEKET